jgi:hypothetical protein
LFSRVAKVALAKTAALAKTVADILDFLAASHGGSPRTRARDCCGAMRNWRGDRRDKLAAGGDVWT